MTERSLNSGLEYNMNKINVARNIDTISFSFGDLDSTHLSIEEAKRLYILLRIAVEEPENIKDVLDMGEI